MIFKIFEFECWLCLSPLRSKHHGEEFCPVRFKVPLYIWQSLNWTRGLGLLLVCGRGHAYIWKRIYLGEIKEYGYHGFWCVKNSNGSFIVVLDRKSMHWKKLNNYIQNFFLCFIYHFTPSPLPLQLNRFLCLLIFSLTVVPWRNALFVCKI